MKLSEFKTRLKDLTEVTFKKSDGTEVPKHFHITEVGEINKRYIDCGGTVRTETLISMQLWESIDFWHRLEPTKLYNIIELSEKKLEIGDHEIEIEYQGETIGKYNIEFENNSFKLIATNTNCLALDKCGISSVEAVREKVATICTPGGGCC